MEAHIDERRLQVRVSCCVPPSHICRHLCVCFETRLSDELLGRIKEELVVVSMDSTLQDICIHETVADCRITHGPLHRLQVYRVLGGELGAVVPSLQLPWRLALGMHLW